MGIVGCRSHVRVGTHQIFVIAAVLLAGNLFCADETAGFRKAKQEFERATDHSEEARSGYITRLTRLREKSARAGTTGWKAIDAEIMRHPAATDLEKAFAKLLEGKWHSPRHDYLYRPDGTWTMLPIETDGTESTHGTWRIEGNECFETAGKPARTSRYTILLLTNKDFAFTDGQVVFYRARLSN
jgi:hypothetical protein